jgi:T5SS/PEP-CTERM-associated repeat protein
MPPAAALVRRLLPCLLLLLEPRSVQAVISVDSSGVQVDARASFDANGDGVITPGDPAENDIAGPQQGDDLDLSAQVDPSRGHGEEHTSVSAGGTALGITSHGVCHGQTALTGDPVKDLLRQGFGVADRHIEFTLTRPASFTFSGSVDTAPSPAPHVGGGDNRALLGFCCLAGQSIVDEESDDAFRDPGGFIRAAASGTLQPGTYSLSARCQTEAPRFAEAGTFDAPSADGSWSFALSVSEECPDSSAGCNDFRWVGGASGAFEDARNWAPQGVPTFMAGVRSDRGHFESGNVVLDLVPDAATAVRGILPRAAASRRMGELVIRGTHTLEPVGGTLFLDDLDPTLGERSLRVGGGKLLLDQGGVTARHASIGLGADGELEVAGPGGFLTTLGRLGIGGDRIGDVTIRDGASVTSAETVLGEGDGAGFATISGASSTWATGNLAVGFAASASLSIEGGARVTSDNAFVDCEIPQVAGVPGCPGLGSGEKAEAIVDGSGAGTPSTWALDGDLEIGPEGKVSIEGGAVLEAAALSPPTVRIGTSGSDADCIAGHACLEVTDGSVAASGIVVGSGGAGKLRVGPAGRVSALTGVTIGDVPLSRGDAVVTGPSADPQLTGSLSIGTELSGHGELLVESGAQVLATDDSKVGGEPGSFGLIEIQANGAAPDATVLRVEGPGTTLDLGVDLAAPADSIFGATGELALAGGRVELQDADLNVHGTGLVSGTGRIAELGVSFVTNDGEIGCGVVIDGAYAQGPDGVLECPEASLTSAPQLNPLEATPLLRSLRKKTAPAPPQGPFVVTGDASLDGTLVLQFLNGFAPRQGDAFRLLDVSGSVTGSFAEVRVRGLAPGANFAQDLANGKLMLTALNDATALPAVSVKARRKLKETKARGTKVKLTRSGDTSQPLVVSYALHGSATNGVDYRELPGTLEIPAGKRSAKLLVVPFDDGVPDGGETVEIEILPGDDYSPSLTSRATIELAEKKKKHG